MSSSPLPIRRAGPNDVLSRSAKDALVVTPSGQLYGSTPGGSRIVYSREQLLSLASSPLSKTPPNIPAEISRSPDKTSSQGGQAFSAKGNGSGSIGSFGKANGAGQAFVGGAGQTGHNGINLHTIAAVAPTSPNSSRNPPPNSSRSPGNAFNFSNGPISPSAISHSSSFKERLAAAQRNSSPDRHHTVRQPSRNGDEANSDSPGKGVNGRQLSSHQGDEQFSMEM